MKGYFGNIENQTLDNKFFRKVVYTAKFSQLVIMSLLPLEEIGMEVHTGDQFFRFEQGTGKVIIDGNEYTVGDGDAIIVPAGAQHNVINTSPDQPLKLYTVYSPPHHRDQVVHETKAQAVADNEEFDQVTTE